APSMGSLASICLPPRQTRAKDPLVQTVPPFPAIVESEHDIGQAVPVDVGSGAVAEVAIPASIDRDCVAEFPSVASIEIELGRSWGLTVEAMAVAPDDGDPSMIGSRSFLPDRGQLY